MNPLDSAQFVTILDNVLYQKRHSLVKCKHKTYYRDYKRELKNGKGLSYTDIRQQDHEKIMYPLLRHIGA